MFSLIRAFRSLVKDERMWIYILPITSFCVGISGNYMSGLQAALVLGTASFLCKVSNGEILAGIMLAVATFSGEAVAILIKAYI